MTDMCEKAENITFGSGASGTAAAPVGFILQPRQRLCGDIGLRVDTNGIWHYRGSPITRESLVRLFASVLRRDSAGDYWLITPAEVAPVTVEDAPFIAVEMRTDGGLPPLLSFRSNIDVWTTASENCPIRVEIDRESGAPAPYIQIANDGTEARLSRSVFYELVERAKETDINGDIQLIVESAGGNFVLGSAREE
jgi:hypothetical protein